MSNEKMREEFEAWLRTAVPGFVAEIDLAKCHDGAYGYEPAASSWRAWQASRAAIEVEFPPEDNTRCCTVAEEAKQEAYNQGLGECRYVIESLGLKVKL